jgi:hypothetical protein
MFIPLLVHQMTWEAFLPFPTTVARHNRRGSLKVPVIAISFRSNGLWLKTQNHHGLMLSYRTGIGMTATIDMNYEYLEESGC